MKVLIKQKFIITLLFLILIFSNFASASQCLKNTKIDFSEKPVFLGNQPPETPDIDGPTMGKPDVELEYTICSSDPEGNDIVYCFDWGDETGQICIGPYPSGEDVTISHTWLENGTYTITVKASDTLGDESGLATLKVRISTSRSYFRTNSNFFNIIHFLRLFYSRNLKFLIWFYKN